MVQSKGAHRSERVARFWLLGAGFAAGAASVVALADAWKGPFDWYANHAWASSMLSNGVVLLATYVIVDRVVDERQQRRWRAAAEPVLRDYADFAGLVSAQLRSNPAVKEPTRDAVAELAPLEEELRRRGVEMADLLTSTPELVDLLEPFRVLHSRLLDRCSTIRHTNDDTWFGELKDDPIGEAGVAFVSACSRYLGHRLKGSRAFGFYSRITGEQL